MKRIIYLGLGKILLKFGGVSLSNKLKHEKLEKRVSTLEKNYKGIEECISAIEELEVVDDLTKETFPGSGRWLFTYENIAERRHISASTVSRIAEKNGISRRSLKSV